MPSVPSAPSAVEGPAAASRSLCFDCGKGCKLPLPSCFPPASPRILPELLHEGNAAAMPRQHRPMLQFAEDEIVMPVGRRKGLHFSRDYMPFHGAILEEFDNPLWARYIGAGSVQSGKTFLFLVIPTLYYLFERGESVIWGLPNIELAQEIWDESLRPVIEAMPNYRDMLPERGKGSRGGRFTYCRFGNGATFRFMGAGGKDTQRVGRTARIIAITEADQMALAGKASKEASPYKQIEARSTSYGALARLFAECVVHTADDLIWRELEAGTNTTVQIRCPHCGAWQYPERKHFLGWQDANTVLEARAKGAYACPACHVLWTENDRTAACASVRLVHHGQTVDAAGVVTGNIPATRTFSVRWNCMHSAMLTMADIAEKEWQAARSERPEDEQELCQFWWAEPYAASATEANTLTANAVREKVGGYARGVVPGPATVTTFFADVMKRYIYWAFTAWEPGAAGWVVDYGVQDVIEGSRSEDEAIIAALDELADRTILAGWLRAGADPKAGGEGAAAPVQPSIVGVDARWKPDAVFSGCRIINVKARRLLCWPCMGDGTSPGQNRFYLPKPSAADPKLRVERPHWYQRFDEVRGAWLTHLDADHWKNFVQGLLLAPAGSPGSLVLFKNETAMEHNSFAQHMVSEKKASEYVPGKGLVERWVRQGRRANHWLDGTGGCCALADMLGISIAVPAPAVARRSTGPPAIARRPNFGNRGSIRSRY